MRDKVVAIAGGAGGIGAEVSERLVLEGARVVIADLHSVQERAAALDKKEGRRSASSVILPVRTNVRRRRKPPWIILAGWMAS